jgi:hypothetical protein
MRACALCAGEDDAANHITDIAAVKGSRGGKFVEDQFDVVSTDFVEKIVGEFNKTGNGALTVRENLTAVMLVPPLEFKFKTTRTDDGKCPTQLIVTGHFMCLVDRRGGKSPRWAFDDERAEYAPENKLAYKRAVAAAVRALGADVLPARIVRFLEIL